MNKIYECADNGFILSIPLCLYARPAVIKALYRFHDQFLISYEIVEEELKIYFQIRKEQNFNAEDKVAEITKELDYQMIRYDTMKQTNEIRQMLVGKALYATCIEPEKSVCTPCTDNSFSWKEDKKMIFKTWSEGNQ